MDKIDILIGASIITIGYLLYKNGKKKNFVQDYGNPKIIGVPVSVKKSFNANKWYQDSEVEQFGKPVYLWTHIN